MLDVFENEYRRLNKAQKEAVDSIDGPVMVVAGPGTGKTQILALRIGQILKETNVGADSVLCLTFTNSGVKAMKERLRAYIGVEASKVHISTFHSFGMSILEKNFQVLGMLDMPKLMDEGDTVAITDAILQDNTWEYLKPKADNGRYFNDLKSLISFLKRERIKPEDFEKLLQDEIKNIKNNDENISTRGESKGKLKKDAEKKIEGLERTLEAMKFYELYEEVKREKNFFDYDDVLENLVRIVEESDDVRSAIKEEYQYVLIDEHQDSSGVQNEFLERVWQGEEKPNIFVVGDDRQLIYGFGGASLEYFENFKNAFGKAKLITLVENYRSTQDVLDSAHNLLQSSISNEKLKSNKKESHPLRLIEASYERDEILLCALEIKENNFDPNEVAILVPKNRHVRSAIAVLKDMGIPVATGEKANFFDAPEAQSFLRVLEIIANPNDGVAIVESFFDKTVGIPPIEAHKFIRDHKMREFTFLDVLEEVNENSKTLFKEENPVKIWIEKLKNWLQVSTELGLYPLVQRIGSEFLLDTAKDHDKLVTRVEVVRTMLHLVLSQIERPAPRSLGGVGNPKVTLEEFLMFIKRLEDYGEHIPLAVFSADSGVKALTLHGSKGLEFDYVWIAHLDEKSLGSSRRGGFTLPESMLEKMEKRDEEVLKRELYVAITRAKRFCTLSYSLHSYTGGDRELASVVQNIEGNFTKQNAEETEAKILGADPKAYTESKATKKESIKLAELQKLVAKDYEDRKVSVSLLNNFFECPWKWYFRNLLQLPEPKAESLEFGNVVHGAIDNILKLNTNKVSETEIKNIIHKLVLKSSFGDEKKQKELEREAFGLITKWVEGRLPRIAKDRENEKSVSLTDERFPHLDIYGKIDLVEITGRDSVRVTDFKTGSPRKKNDIEKMDNEGRMSDYMRQLAMYSYLLGENSKWKKEVAESRLEYVQAKSDKEMFYDTYIDREKIDLLVRDIMDYDEMVKTGTWSERPCNFKSYGKQNAVLARMSETGGCEYCKMGEIYK